MLVVQLNHHAEVPARDLDIQWKIQQSQPIFLGTDLAVSHNRVKTNRYGGRSFILHFTGRLP